MILSHGTKSHMLGHKLLSRTYKTKQLVPVHLDLVLEVPLCNSKTFLD